MNQKFFLAFFILSFFLLPAPVAAQDTCNFEDLNLQNGFDCVERIREHSGIKEAKPIDIVIAFLNVALTLAAIIAVIALVIAGFRYITAAGDESKAEKAKHAILYAIIGLVVIGISIAIVNLVVGTLIRP